MAHFFVILYGSLHILFLYISDAELRKENLYYVVLDLGVRTTVPEIDHYYTLHSHSYYMLLQYKC